MNSDTAKPLRAVHEPRILIVSQRALRPDLSRCALYEMEDVIAEVDDVDLVVPRAAAQPVTGLRAKLADALERRVGVRVERVPQAGGFHVEQDYDVLYYHAENIFDLAALQRIRGWRKRCRVALCRIEELWLHLLDNAKALRALQEFDHVFLGCEQTAPELERRIRPAVHYLPPATDALRFCPFPDPPPRSIDCLSIGRRAADLHEALLSHAHRAPHDFFYVFDTREGNSVVSRPERHRRMLADQIQRARYFVVNIAKGDSTKDTHGQQELGYRFFEGAAGGSVLLGTAPRCDSFRRCFDWSDAVIELSGTGADVAGRIAELDADPTALERLRRINITSSLRRHDHGHRWAHMLDLGGIAVRPALERRLLRLEQVAASIEQPPTRIESSR